MRALFAGTVLACAMHAVTARAAEPSARATKSGAPAHVFAQAGVGLLEVLHLELGAFVLPRLSLEAMGAVEGVFGVRFGGGLFTSIGPRIGDRPPRHALTLGSRIMLDEHATFDSHGDDLSSYAVFPVGYAFLADDGFYFRATAGPVLVRERTDELGTSGATTRGHRWIVSGPFLTAAAGIAF